jgi:hypothetical protein
MPDRTQPPSLEERLKPYGLTSNEVHLDDFVLGEGECIRLTLRGDSRFAKIAKRVTVRTIHDLKRMIGVPDSVVQQSCHCRFEQDLTESVPAGFKSLNDLSYAQKTTLVSAAKEYIHGNSRAVAHYEPALNTAIGLANRSIISIVLFRDIIVERNATLTLDSSVDVIFANRILVKLGGKIRALGTFVKYDCTSVQGEEYPYMHLTGPLASAVLPQSAAAIVHP